MRVLVILTTLATLGGCNVNDHYLGVVHHDAQPPVTHDAHTGVPDGYVPDAYVPDAAVDGHGMGGGCISSASSHDTGLRPVAPTATDFMWPSLQTRFRRLDGTTCTGQVTATVGDRVVCYVGVDDDVHCAGAVYTHNYGPGFVGLGRYGVDQVVVTPTFNTETGNAICIHERAGTAHCMGDANGNGQFANGTTTPTATFTQWSALTTITHFGGVIDIRCALDAAGEVYCAGYTIGPTAVRQDTGGGHRSIWVTSFGEVRIDDPAVFREANGSPCETEADGLHCGAPFVPMLTGTPGSIVDGTVTVSPGGLARKGDQASCRLEPSGRVWCATDNDPITERYTCAPPMLALAGNFYTSTQCAVANDGSLWCRGKNEHGELGMTGPVPDDTMVQPPGSVKIVCE